MSRQESKHPEDWLAKAAQDLTRVQVLLNADDPEGAGFHLQQAVEKCLKACLLLHHVIPRRIHDLSILLDDVLLHQPRFERFRDLCELTTGFYIPQRYPFLAIPPPTKEEVRALLAQAQELLEEIQQFLVAE